ncbi:MAG: MmcB family DNA repair protein [Alphaproteobacteria bacterium]
MDGSAASLSLTGAAAILRGTGRLLRDMGETCIAEFSLRTGRRVDLIGLGSDGTVTIVEVKSSVADYRSDRKWHEYLPFCDRFYFAVDAAFPQDMIPPECGLIVADAYAAVMLRAPAPGTMNPSRRRALTLKFARDGARRLHDLVDPGIRG